VTGDTVGPGARGGLVITDLAREGSPLLRFWIGLETTLIETPCPCGRTSARSPFVRPLA
jgi:phenylacetate-CoA ligase